MTQHNTEDSSYLFCLNLSSTVTETSTITEQMDHEVRMPESYKVVLIVRTGCVLVSGRGHVLVLKERF